MKRLLPVALVLLASCTIVRTKEGATQADYNRDTYECERDVRQSKSEDPNDARAFYERCLQARGYSSTMKWNWQLHPKQPAEPAPTPQTEPNPTPP